MDGASVVPWILIVVVSSISAEESRLACHKCLYKDRCYSLGGATRVTCLPKVRYCVQRKTISRVTGSKVTERYCGGQDFLDATKGKDLVEEKCYSKEVNPSDRISTATCYCAHDYCNTQPPQATLTATLLALCLTLTLSYSVKWFTIFSFVTI